MCINPPITYIYLERIKKCGLLYALDDAIEKIK